METEENQRAVESTYYAAKLNTIFRTSKAIRSHLKDQLPRFATSFCVYSFECSCGASYIGRTSRRLSERINEHHPAWLRNGLSKSSCSAITTHLVDSGHSITRDSCFKGIHRVPSRYSRIAKLRLLCVAESIFIRLVNPILCIQKQSVRTLRLCWPAHCQQQTSHGQSGSVDT